MESEMRLVFIDWGLPTPELQYEIVDRHGQLWRVDFAWPECRVAAEYDSMDWHANPVAVKHDRMKSARLQEISWISVPAVVDDVRRYPAELSPELRAHLNLPPDVRRRRRKTAPLRTKGRFRSARGESAGREEDQPISASAAEGRSTPPAWWWSWCWCPRPSAPGPPAGCWDRARCRSGRSGRSAPGWDRRRAWRCR